MPGSLADNVNTYPKSGRLPAHTALTLLTDFRKSQPHRHHRPWRRCRRTPYHALFNDENLSADEPRLRLQLSTYIFHAASRRIGAMNWEKAHSQLHCRSSKTYLSQKPSRVHRDVIHQPTIYQCPVFRLAMPSAAFTYEIPFSQAYYHKGVNVGPEEHAQARLGELRQACINVAMLDPKVSAARFGILVGNGVGNEWHIEFSIKDYRLDVNTTRSARTNGPGYAPGRSVPFSTRPSSSRTSRTSDSLRSRPGRSSFHLLSLAAGSGECPWLQETFVIMSRYSVISLLSCCTFCKYFTVVLIDRDTVNIRRSPAKGSASAITSKPMDRQRSRHKDLDNYSKEDTVNTILTTKIKSFYDRYTRVFSTCSHALPATLSSYSLPCVISTTTSSLPPLMNPSRFLSGPRDSRA